MKKFILLIITLASPQLFAQWYQAENPENIRLGVGGFGIIGDTLFTGSALTVGFDGDLKALYKSGDDGATWIKANPASGLRNEDLSFYSLTGLESGLYLARNRELNISTDGGLNWIKSGTFPSGDESIPRHFVQLGDVIVGATQGDTNGGSDGVFRKVGDGDWTPANEGLPEAQNDRLVTPQIFDVELSGDRILLTAGSDVYFSDDTAKTWTRFTGFGTYISQLAVGNNLVIGTGFRSGTAYLYKSDDNGTTFERIDRPDSFRPGVRTLHFSDGYFYAALEANFDGDGGIYISEDGENWSLLGLQNARITNINTTDEKVLVTVQNWINADSLRGVWTYPKSEIMITSSEMATRANTFSLNQNYPNPFNPTTSISFELSEAGLAQLEVFNMLGQKVATLVDGYITAGAHISNFDASGLSSGVYIYRLKVSESIQVRRMMLIK